MNNEMFHKKHIYIDIYMLHVLDTRSLSVKRKITSP